MQVDAVQSALVDSRDIAPRAGSYERGPYAGGHTRQSPCSCIDEICRRMLDAQVPTLQDLDWDPLQSHARFHGNRKRLQFPRDICRYPRRRAGLHSDDTPAMKRLTCVIIANEASALNHCPSTPKSILDTDIRQGSVSTQRYCLSHSWFTRTFPSFT